MCIQTYFGKENKLKIEIGKRYKRRDESMKHEDAKKLLAFLKENS